jgi:hypothetical protein
MDERDIERVARALARKARVSEMEASGFNGIHLNEYVDACWADHKDRARAAIAAMEGDGWQDVATAPRNAMVLIANSGLGYVDRQIACRRDYSESGWVDQNGQPISVGAKPTHWRPLPALPGEA